MFGQVHQISRLVFIDRRLIISGSQDGNLVIWSARSKGVKKVLKGHDSSITALTLNSDRDLLVSASHDGNMRIWNLHSFTSRKSLGNPCAVKALKILNDDATLVSGDSQGGITVWNLNTAATVKSFDAHHGEVTSLSLLGRSRLISVGADGHIKVWLTESWTCFFSLKAHDEIINEVSISPNGRYLATASQDKTVLVWDVNDEASEVEPRKVNLLTKKEELYHHLRGVSSVKFANDETLLTASKDDTIRVCDITSGEVTQTIMCGLQGVNDMSIIQGS